MHVPSSQPSASTCGRFDTARSACRCRASRLRKRTERPPNIHEISQILHNPKSSLVVNLSGLPQADRPLFFAVLLPKLQELRAKTGRPHWIIVDEAHHLLPRERGQGAGVIPQEFTGIILITEQVDAVLPAALKSMTGIIAVGASPEETIRQCDINGTSGQ